MKRTVRNLLQIIAVVVFSLVLNSNVFAEDLQEGGDPHWPGTGISTSADNLRDGKRTVLEIDEEVLSVLSNKERDWYRRFHEGVMFFDGWSAISQDILNAFPEEQLPEKKKLVQRLGVKIGTEWCRDNESRRIDTGMLKAWGDKLRAVIKEGPEEISEQLQEIEMEVDTILGSEGEVSLVEPRS